MENQTQNTPDPSDETGVSDVRIVRNKIAARYPGDLRKHAAETDQLVAPLIEKLGLKQGTPAPQTTRRSGTDG